MEVDPATIDNAVLKRLLEEIANDEAHPQRAYDRIHNRHNRGMNPQPPPQVSPIPEEPAP